MKTKIISLAVLIPFVGGCAVDPHRWTTPSDASHSPTVVPSKPFEVTREPLPTQKPLITRIYVVDNGVSVNWKLQEAVLSWQKAKYTEIKLVKNCPLDWKIPCVNISEVENLPTEYAGETRFGNLPNQIQINLNKKVTWINGFEKQTTVCHEFGHVLGLGHATGSRKTCMYDGNYYRQWPLGATRLDIQAVDALGPWDHEKMYESSAKELDFRPKPR